MSKWADHVGLCRLGFFYYWNGKLAEFWAKGHGLTNVLTASLGLVCWKGTLGGQGERC